MEPTEVTAALTKVSLSSDIEFAAAESTERSNSSSRTSVSSVEEAQGGTKEYGILSPVDLLDGASLRPTSSVSTVLPTDLASSSCVKVDAGKSQGS